MFGIKARRRLVRQLERFDCGPAALLTVLRFHGGDAALAALRCWCKADSRGVTLLDLLRAAERCGFQARGARGSYDDLSTIPLPCIAHLVREDGQHHYVVVYRVAHSRVQLGDPARGVYWIRRQPFARLWQSQTVLLLTPTANLVRQPAMRGWPWIASYLTAHLPWVEQSIFLGILTALLGLMTAGFVQVLIDRYIPGGDVRRIFYAGVILLFFLLLRAAVGLLRSIFLVVLNQRINLAMTRDFFTRLFRLPQPFFDQRKTGDITARLNDSLKIQQAISLIAQSAFIDLLVVIGSLALMAYYSLSIALLCLLSLPLFAALLLQSSRRIRDQQSAVMNEHSRMESATIDRLRGIREVIAFGVALAAAQALLCGAERLQFSIARLHRTQAKLKSISEALAALLTLALLTLGSVAVAEHRLQLGELLALVALLSYLLPSIANLVQAVIAWQGAQIAADRLLDLLAVEPEPNPGRVAVSEIAHLQTENLHFSYPKSALLLRGVDLAVERGFVTALWGKTGSGKSTLVYLLQRRLQPDTGSILCNGRSAEEIDLHCYRRLVAVVPQRAHLFNATVLENVLLGRAAVDRQRIDQVLQSVGLFDGSEAGFDLSALLGEAGRRLSGGEIRLLSLARALVAEPAVLIVDELFSELDDAMKARVWQTLRNYANDHAVLLVTHDSEILQGCELVFRLQDGRATFDRQTAKPPCFLSTGKALSSSPKGIN